MHMGDRPAPERLWTQAPRVPAYAPLASPKCRRPPTAPHARSTAPQRHRARGRRTDTGCHFDTEADPMSAGSSATPRLAHRVPQDRCAAGGCDTAPDSTAIVRLMRHKHFGTIFLTDSGQDDHFKNEALARCLCGSDPRQDQRHTAGGEAVAAPGKQTPPTPPSVCQHPKFGTTSAVDHAPCATPGAPSAWPRSASITAAYHQSAGDAARHAAAWRERPSRTSRQGPPRS